MALSVDGKVAIVTGAGSGINLSFTRLLLSSNCSVILADLTLRPEASELISTYSTERTPTKPQAIFQPTDVTSWAALSAVFDLAVNKFGGVDIVCPGAGIFEPQSSNFWYPPTTTTTTTTSPSSSTSTSPSVDNITSSRYKTLDVNLTHPIRCTQLAISHFLSRYPPGSALPENRSSRGVVLHISSVSAQVATLLTPLYSASKAGLSHFVRAFRPLEQRLAIRVVAVAPGIVKTPLWTDAPDKLKMFDESADQWVLPDEVASVMLECVQDAEKVGGTIWEVAGGVRKVEVVNDPGPGKAGRGLTVKNVGVAYEEVFGLLEGGDWGL